MSVGKSSDGETRGFIFPDRVVTEMKSHPLNLGGGRFTGTTWLTECAVSCSTEVRYAVDGGASISRGRHLVSRLHSNSEGAFE